MKERFQLAIWLMWLAAPVIALDYWRVWDRLPARMAVHFDINWQANGWASRGAAAQFGVLVVLLLLVVFTLAGHAMANSPVPAFVGWSLLVFFYGVLICSCAVNHWVVRYNLDAGKTSSLQSTPVDGFHKAELMSLETENWELRTHH